MQRAQYILAQHGLPSLETEKLEDPELIMKIMDAREMLDEATSLDEVEDVRSENDGAVPPFSVEYRDTDRFGSEDEGDSVEIGSFVG